ncbi:MAG: hypothetical protein ABL927_09365 [Bdellovibrionales bacterium]
MAARDRYTLEVGCSECETTGVIHISENDYPFMRRIDKQVDKIVGPFVASVEEGLHLSAKCSQCNRVIINPQKGHAH